MVHQCYRWPDPCDRLRCSQYLEGRDLRWFAPPIYLSRRWHSVFWPLPAITSCSVPACPSCQRADLVEALVECLERSSPLSALSASSSDVVETPVRWI